MRKTLAVFCTLLGLGLLSSMAFANTEVRNLQPGNWSEVSVQVRAASVYQYQPVVMCNSRDFQMRHFTSVYRGGILNVELRYSTKGFPRGAACYIFFVEDELTEFDFATGLPLSVGQESFRFVIQ